MIITKSLSYPEIKRNFKKNSKIGIVSCNACAKMCQTGGELKMEEIGLKLKKDGFNVIDSDLIGVACDFNQLKKGELHGDTTLVLACDSAVYNLRKLFPKRKIVPALKTLGIGAYDHKGHIFLVKKFK
jgi:hypothetical protein